MAEGHGECDEPLRLQRLGAPDVTGIPFGCRWPIPPLRLGSHPWLPTGLGVWSWNQLVRNSFHSVLSMRLHEVGLL